MKTNKAILPENMRDIERYMTYREQVLQNDPKTVRRCWIELRHLLEWSGMVRLSEVQDLTPTFPAYLLTARNDGRDFPIGPAHMTKICQGTRLFFKWARRDLAETYAHVSESWIETIRPRRSASTHTVIKDLQAWQHEDILKIARLKLSNLGDIRDQAAMCFLYLSGMRITAFATLPVDCVDIAARRVEQLPAKGVKTKNSKAAITSLYSIPELLAVVEAWDRRVKAALPGHFPWYAVLGHEGRYFEMDPERVNTAVHEEGRRQAASRGIQRLCQLAGVPYKSPHKLRHGHAVYGVKHAQNMQELKAVSQNLMHSSISITDGIYGNLTSSDVIHIITSMGEETPAQPTGDPSALILQALAKLASNPDLLGKVLAA